MLNYRGEHDFQQKWDTASKEDNPIIYHAKRVIKKLDDS